MREYQGKTLSWHVTDGTVELLLDHAPCNEIGLAMLADLECFADALNVLESQAHVLIVSSARESGFSAGADLRALYRESQKLPVPQRVSAVREFLERIHRVLNRIDVSPLTTIAAVHGVTFGG